LPVESELFICQMIHKGNRKEAREETVWRLIAFSSSAVTCWRFVKATINESMLSIHNGPPDGKQQHGR
jgi:hypothetical protein